MPTYSEIQESVQHRHGFVPKTARIAHVKILGTVYLTYTGPKIFARAVRPGMARL